MEKEATEGKDVRGCGLDRERVLTAKLATLLNSTLLSDVQQKELLT